MERPWRKALIGLCLATGSACSLMVDASGLDAGCPAGQKPCSGQCVAIDDPRFGCTRDLCLPCELANAVPTCREDNVCIVRECILPFGCPGENRDHGCPINLTFDAFNCGACGTVCHSPCRDSTCAVTECDAGFANCNGSAADGCETDLDGASNCGACGVRCAAGEVCQNRLCQPSIGGAAGAGP